MQALFAIDNNGKSMLIEQSMALDEGKDLQELLEKNQHLLPGDQIADEDEEPLRWFLIKREMPVESPTTGSVRWSLDFLFVDDHAVPTFVECKLQKNPEARREIVGQMLEYVANAQHYWRVDSLKKFIDVGALERFIPDRRSPDDFQNEMFKNLVDGKVRMIFFMDKAPSELKSIVMFLNEALAKASVLIVEAQQFVDGDRRYISPVLFGYTERVRAAKNRMDQQTGDNGKWSDKKFKAKLDQIEQTEQRAAALALFEYGHTDGFQIKWGRGKQGSMNVVALNLCPRSFFTLWGTGDITVNLGWIGEELRTDFENRLNTLGIQYRHDLDYPVLRLAEWYSNSRKLIDMFDGFVKQQ